MVQVREILEPVTYLNSINDSLLKAPQVGRWFI